MNQNVNRGAPLAYRENLLMSDLQLELVGAFGLELLLEACELREELGERLAAMRREEARGVRRRGRADGQAGHHSCGARRRCARAIQRARCGEQLVYAFELLPEHLQLALCARAHTFSC